MAIGPDCGTCARQRRRRRRSKIAMHKGIRIGSGWGSSLVYDSSRSRRRCERHWPKLKCPVESISHLRRGRRIASLILSCSLTVSHSVSLFCLQVLALTTCGECVLCAWLWIITRCIMGFFISRPAGKPVPIPSILYHSSPSILLLFSSHICYAFCAFVSCH